MLILPQDRVEETISRIRAGKLGLGAWDIGTIARRTGDGEQVVVSFD